MEIVLSQTAGSRFVLACRKGTDVTKSDVGRGVLDERIDQILAIVREVLANPNLNAADEVMEHGATSLAIVRILTETSNRLDLTINPRDLNGVVTAVNLAQVAR